MTVTAEMVLSEVNVRHRTSWRLQGRLSGGYQSGAYLITDHAGRRALLKWSDSREWAPVVVAAESVVAGARGAGWPTPVWLAAGTTADGYAYQLQEFVEGSSREAITHEWLDLVLPMVARQAGLGRDGMRNWSAYDHDVVYATGNANRSAVASSGSAGAQLVAVITRLNRGHEDVRLPDRDLVHGDLNPENVLIADGTVSALIDVEAVGRGSRLHDLTTLLLYATLWGDQEEVRSRLIAECRTIADRGWLEITLSAVTVDLLAFGVRNWPSDDLAAACRTAATLLSAARGP